MSTILSISSVVTHSEEMAKVPATKRRRLSPPAKAEKIAPSTLVPDSGKDGGECFMHRAALWNLEQDYEQRPRKKKKNDKESTRLPIKTAEGHIQQVAAPSKVESDGDSWLDSENDLEPEEEKVAEQAIEPVSKASIRRQILDAKEELARIASLINEDPEEHVCVKLYTVFNRLFVLMLDQGWIVSDAFPIYLFSKCYH